MAAKKRVTIDTWCKRVPQAWRFDEDCLPAVARIHAQTGDYPDFQEWQGWGETQGLVQEVYRLFHRHYPVYAGRFMTPLAAALAVVDHLSLDSGATVFDPCAGTGNLLWAAERRGLQAQGIELDLGLQKTAQELGHDVGWGDWLHPAREYDHSWIDAVVMNPPYGNLQGQSEISLAFLQSVAGWGKPVVALLPAWHEEHRSRGRLLEHYWIEEELEQPADLFEPLTAIRTRIYVLEAKPQVQLQLSLGI